MLKAAQDLFFFMLDYPNKYFFSSKVALFPGESSFWVQMLKAVLGLVIVFFVLDSQNKY